MVRTNCGSDSNTSDDDKGVEKNKISRKDIVELLTEKKREKKMDEKLSVAKKEKI